MKRRLLQLHRWITLVFSLPLAVLLITGLVLSFEPMVATNAIVPGSLSAQKLDGLLAQHDPAGKARGLFVRSYDGPAGSMTLVGAADKPKVIDLATGEEKPGTGRLAGLFQQSRMLHEHMLDLRWLVSLSTAAMLVLIALGVLMGWPRLANSLSGWHKGLAWIGLPLVIASPLTGLFIAFGVTFAPSTPSPRAAAPTTLRETVQTVAATHDPSRLIWIRSRGNAQLVRLDDAGEYRVYAAGRDGLVATPRNWPRLIHEGNWAGTLSAMVDVITSVVLIGLLATGLVLWGRRTLRRRRNARAAAGVAA